MADRALITIVPKGEQIERAMKELARIKNGAPRALAAAINKTLPGVRTDIRREVQQRYTAKAGKIGKSIKISKRASPSDLTGVVAGNYKPIPLIDFKVSPKTITNPRPAGGLKVEVIKGESKMLPHAFIAPLGGTMQIAERVGKQRFPIKVLYGPSAIAAIQDDAVFARLNQAAADRLEKNLDHEIDRLDKGY